VIVDESCIRKMYSAISLLPGERPTLDEVKAGVSKIEGPAPRWWSDGARLFDLLVGAHQNRWGYGKTERLDRARA
jgi:hypothetical protein